jgi:hypothetical protein
VQFIDRDEPKMNPKPLETLQLSTPTLTPWAWDGVAATMTPSKRVNALTATASLLCIR